MTELEQQSLNTHHFAKVLSLNSYYCLVQIKGSPTINLCHCVLIDMEVLF